MSAQTIQPTDLNAAIAAQITAQNLAMQQPPCPIWAVNHFSPKPAPQTAVVRQTITIEAGRLLCGPIRDFLGEMRVLGHVSDWHESRGLLSRTFTVTGLGIGAVSRALSEWFGEQAG